MIKKIAHGLAGLGFLANVLTPLPFIAAAMNIPMTLVGGLVEVLLGVWVYAIYLMLAKNTDNQWYLLACAPLGIVSWILWGPFLAIVNGSPMQGF